MLRSFRYQLIFVKLSPKQTHFMSVNGAKKLSLTKCVFIISAKMLSSYANKDAIKR